MARAKRENKSFIIITSDIDYIQAFDILKYRLENHMWGLHKNTRGKLKIYSGCNLIFYLAGRKKLAQHLVATAKIKAISHSFSRSDLNLYTFNLSYCTQIPEIKILLEQIEYFKSPIYIKDHTKNLELFPKKPFFKWGVYLQGGIKQISLKDYNYIVIIGSER